MEYSISLITGYLIGSIPFAYLILKKARGIDITQTGTGNVGAMNSYEVTNSKALGLLVLVLDLLKGFLSIYIPSVFFPGEFSASAVSLLAAVFSHCFNPWLQFKGGRGLATAAGGILFIFPLLLVIWIILWTIIYLWKRDIHLGNLAATLLSLFLTYNLAPIAYKYTYPKVQSVPELVVFATGLFILILIRHIDPLKELIRNPKILYRKRR
jgi:acyl phosphate:glycerol-3-phosphate acyltransferase